MSELRQQLLVLHLHTPDLNSGVVAWALYDGTGQKRYTTGDSEAPPYNSVVEAMQDGWRVIQFPQQFLPIPAWNIILHISGLNISWRNWRKSND